MGTRRITEFQQHSSSGPPSQTNLHPAFSTHTSEGREGPVLLTFASFVCTTFPQLWTTFAQGVHLGLVAPPSLSLSQLTIGTVHHFNKGMPKTLNRECEVDSMLFCCSGE